MVPHGVRTWSAYKGPQICSFLLILLPHILAVFVTSLIQTAVHKMAARTVSVYF